MIFYILAFFIAFMFLKLLNYLLTKNKFALDGILAEDSHKKFANLNTSVPLSGALYFTPLVFFFNLNDWLFLLICISFACLGFLSDIRYLNAPKKRLLIQIILILIYLLFNKDLIIDIRIDFINNYLEVNLFRVLIISFFILVLINGYNFIDGVNILSSLNFLIVLFFSLLLINNNYDQNISKFLIFLIIFLIVFLPFNFIGKNFLGDGGVYLLSLITGLLLIKISQANSNISPYFIANLLWYPAFENLFTILRRVFLNKKNYLPDNNHLHQLIFKYFKIKNLFKKNYLISSFVGILINLYLLIFYFIGYMFYENTNIQIFLILFGIFSYLITFFILKIKLN